MSTKPKVPLGKFTKQDVTNKKVNLLFFGNFYNMDYQAYEDGMWEMIKSKEYLYGSLMKDFYNLGVVLSKKYKYLRICYSVFMYGIILAILSFIVSQIMMTP